eukprot:TRINITY_DN5331_c0_g1_i6.p1 TRINITY_DN5331_c0_g1~~TRINITY_DN5331_c0_g1_i6.p1  ORF type:complete len:604 (-),score=102.99 TRINITY_DN5331_c0_g1_i6:133-1944(-)
MTLLRVVAVLAALPLVVTGLTLHRGNSTDEGVSAHLDKAAAGASDVPVSSWCVVVLSVQYVLIFTSLALVRTYAEVMEIPKGIAEHSLKVAGNTVSYSPMLCVLFIACRMRVTFLTDGQQEPPAWVGSCMKAATFALVGQSILVLVVPFVSGAMLPFASAPSKQESEEMVDDDDEADDDEPLTARASSPCFLRFMVFRYAIMALLYGGIAGVIIGTLSYLPPGVTDYTTLPSPAPAVACSMWLAVLFFTMELVVIGAETYSSCTGKPTSRLTGVMNAAINTTAFAPMMAILFLAARMRALQHDSQPQAWAQDAMFSSTGALVMTTFLAILVPVALHGKATTDPVTKETTYDVPSAYLYSGYALVAVRYLALLGFYGGTGVVAYSIFTFESPRGAEHTVPVSPTVKCVVLLCAQYFLIYFALNVMHTITQVSRGAYKMEQYRIYSGMEKARASVAFAPMLAVLFVSTRSYALFLTNNKGAPQAWAQDGMYMSTWALLISFVICLTTSFVMDEVKTDEDGNVINKFSNWYAGVAMSAARYVSMLLLYGGMFTVAFGLITMTKETANGRGSIPVVTDAVNSTPIGSPPSVPGSKASFLGLVLSSRH